VTNWHFFQALMAQLTTLIQGGGDAILNGTLGYVRPALLIGITAWLAFKAIMVANGFAPLNEIYRDLIRSAVVVFLLQSAATYNQYVGNLAVAIPAEVGAALAAIGANGNVANGAAFDGVWNTAAKAGFAVFEHIPKYSLSSIPLWFAVIVFLAIALVAVGASFLIYLASTVLLLLLLKAGPLFVALFAFPIAARFASGWVAAVVSAILTQIFTVAILVMFIGVEANTVDHITQGVTGGALANFIDEIVTLGEAALLMCLIASLVKQAPSFAGSIAHGVFQNVSGLVGTAGNVAGGAVKTSIGAIALGGRGVSAGVRRTAAAARVSRPTGKSLSEG
jgi:hypothetical protein